PELQVFRAFGVVGKSSERANFQGKEGVLAREALRDAAYRAAQVLAGVPAQEVAARPQKAKKHKAWRWFLIAAGIAALAVAANSSTSSRPAPPAGNEYRPRNLTAVAQPAGQNSILVSWQPPTRTQNLMGYELQRASRPKTGGMGTSYQTVAGLTQLTASTTQWNDHGLSGTMVYIYRLRARYSDRQPIPDDWVYTGWVGFSQ
ncbi:MAG: fibronectin type III domain-containing protein, partial [Armatimonadetes bacterium]|nr:fibronectin type III domain-containing protein [Armatimonadota bacterium]